MTTWTTDQLALLEPRAELDVAPLRADGVTHRPRTPIWFVVIDGQVIARAFTGQDSFWFRAAVRQGIGLIYVAGHEFEVEFHEGATPSESAIDEAYKVKYAGSPHLPPMLVPLSQNAVITISPLGDLS